MVDKKTRILVTAFSGIVLVSFVLLMLSGFGDFIFIIGRLLRGYSPDYADFINAVFLLFLAVVAVVFSVRMFYHAVTALKRWPSGADKKHFGTFLYIVPVSVYLVIRFFYGTIVWTAEYFNRNYSDAFMTMVSEITRLLTAAAVAVFSIILINLEKNFI